MRNLIIDTDGGIDDALALAMVINSPHFNILAITTTYGNVSVEEATRNILYILSLYNRSDIPVFKGCKDPLNGLFKESEWPCYGKDGLGDITTSKEYFKPLNQAEEQFAPEAIIEIAKKFENVSILAIGPLTNISTALSKEPELPNFIESLTVMGGNHKKNFAEFNVLCDPLAFRNVTSSSFCIELITYCLTEELALSWEWYDHNLTFRKDGYRKLWRNMTKVYEHHLRQENDFNLCDGVAACCLLNRDMIVKSKETTVEVDINEGIISFNQMGSNNIKLILECNKSIFENIVSCCLDMDLYQG